jgi:hypothetical protein
MDRAAIQELITFTDYAWHTYVETIRPLGDDVLTQPAPGPDGRLFEMRSGT